MPPTRNTAFHITFFQHCTCLIKDHMVTLNADTQQRKE